MPLSKNCMLSSHTDVKKILIVRLLLQDSDLEGSVPDRITLDHTEIVGSDISEIKRNITPCSTLPSRLEPGFCKEWDEVDELLQVERRVDDKQKLYQTLPAGVVLRPIESPDQNSSENTSNEERDSGVGKHCKSAAFCERHSSG